MKKRGIFAVCAALAVLVPTVLGGFAVNAFAADNDKGDRLKGVWVATVYRLDYPKTASTDEAVLKRQADEILDGAASMGLNAVFFQVRPGSDAFYDSKIYPWSKYLTGTQGTAPENGFDPLEYWTEGAHARGMELHAWINPYRITKNGDSEYASLAEENPAKQHPDYVIRSTDGNYYYDPAVPEVRDLVVEGALEIVNHYDVDGIHLDDYFYPSQDFPDDESFACYGEGFADKGDWRRENVNLLIKDLDRQLHAADPNLSFGVSPSGIWANKSTRPEGSDTRGSESYNKQYADTRAWVKEGWVDYIAPQIYWNIGYSVADYKILTEWWNDAVDGTDTELYIGMADYRTVDAAAESAFYGTGEIKRQLDLNRTYDNVSGEIHFRYGSLVSGEGLDQMLASYYRFESGIRFSDLSESKWAEDYIYKLAEQGIVNGMGENRFAPAASVKRSEYIKMLMNTFGYDSDPFVSGKAVYTDVPDSYWGYRWIACAKEQGILENSAAFRPEEPITREDMALYSYRAIKGTGTLLGSGSKEIAFADENEISPAAENAVRMLVGAGVLNGYPDGSFGAKKTSTRAEACKVICVLLDAYSESH